MPEKRPPAPVVREIERVRVEPGDVLVLEIPRIMTVAEERLLAEQLREVWPRNKALVLSAGAKLRIGVEVGRRAATQAETALRSLTQRRGRRKRARR